MLLKGRPLECFVSLFLFATDLEWVAAVEWLTYSFIYTLNSWWMLLQTSCCVFVSLWAVKEVVGIWKGDTLQYDNTGLGASICDWLWSEFPVESFLDVRKWLKGLCKELSRFHGSSVAWPCVRDLLTNLNKDFVSEDEINPFSRPILTTSPFIFLLPHWLPSLRHYHSTLSWRQFFTLLLLRW